MEDLASMITQFLGSEEGMNQLRAVTEALGLDSSGAENGGGPPPAPASSPSQQPSAPQEQGGGGPDLGALFSSLGTNAGSQPDSSGLDLNTMLLLGRAISAFSQEDRNTELLRALKPHFSQERAKKVDDAIKILQLIRLLPLVKDLGILPHLRGGEEH